MNWHHLDLMMRTWKRIGLLLLLILLVILGPILLDAVYPQLPFQRPQPAEMVQFYSTRRLLQEAAVHSACISYCGNTLGTQWGKGEGTTVVQNFPSCPSQQMLAEATSIVGLLLCSYGVGGDSPFSCITYAFVQIWARLLRLAQDLTL